MLSSFCHYLAVWRSQNTTKIVVFRVFVAFISIKKGRGGVQILTFVLGVENRIFGGILAFAPPPQRGQKVGYRWVIQNILTYENPLALLHSGDVTEPLHLVFVFESYNFKQSVFVPGIWIVAVNGKSCTKYALLSMKYPVQTATYKHTITRIQRDTIHSYLLYTRASIK